MDKETIHRLNDLNRQFYKITATDFNQTRNQPWPGWLELLPYLRSPLRVLDVGCGNGRFGLFLAENLGPEIMYHGLDNSPQLLGFARQSLTDAGINFQLSHYDIITQPLSAGSEYDLVTLFGVLHHIPGYQNRMELMRAIAQLVAPDGFLAFACWRFYEILRFRRRIIPWPEDYSVERHDYLLDWQRGETALRYCHYVDDIEHAALVESTRLTEVTTYRADGKTNDLNCYSLVQKAQS